MGKVTINLMEGFNDDDVKVIIDGQPVFSGKISTAHQIGLAHSEVFESVNDKIDLSIIVDGKSILKRKKIDTTQPVHVGINLDAQKRSVVEIRDKPYYFM